MSHSDDPLREEEPLWEMEGKAIESSLCVGPVQSVHVLMLVDAS